MSVALRLAVSSCIGGAIAFSPLQNHYSRGVAFYRAPTPEFRNIGHGRLSESVLVDSFVEWNQTSTDLGNGNVDVGKELFLSTVEDNPPAIEENIGEVFSIDVINEETRSQVEDFVLGVDRTQDVAVVGIPEDLSIIDLSMNTKQLEDGLFSSDVSLPLDSQRGISSVSNGTVLLNPASVDEERMEMVEAVLAASEDAAALAEASLQEDVAQEPPVESSNDTGFSMPVTVENVPKILSASDVVGEPVTKEKVESPSVSKILKFAVPAIGVWLCSPLLSLIDTSAVGILSGTVQQAALNPAVAVTDYAALLIAFLYAASTNMVASAQESERTLPGRPHTKKALVGAMQLSTFVGVGLGSLLFVFARTLLRAIIGNDAVNPAVFAAAMKYVRIRAIGMPAAAIIGSAQAACLGMQDIRSPLYVLAAAAIVNFFGDMLFVRSSHALVGGAAGAAWATVFSQYAAVGLFVYWLTHKPKEEKPVVMDLTNAIMELTGSPSSTGASRRKKFRDSLLKRDTSDRANDLMNESSDNGGMLQSLRKKRSSLITKLNAMVAESPLASRIAAIRSRSQRKPQTEEKSFSVRGLLAGQFAAKDLLKMPQRDVVEKFKPFVVPVTTTQVGRVSGYVAMSHVVSSALGTTSMAAQQVIVSIFYCLCPIADSLSLTAQSFVPGLEQKKPSKERSMALRRITMNFGKAGILFGSLMVAAVGLIPFISRFFTSDPVVVGMVNMVAPLLVLFFSVHGIVCGMEGMLLGRKDLNFLGKMYGAFFAAVPYFMLRVKRAALSGVQGVNLSTVWKVFIMYQLFRAAAFSARVASQQRKTEIESNGLDSTNFDLDNAYASVAP